MANSGDVTVIFHGAIKIYEFSIVRYDRCGFPPFFFFNFYNDRVRASRSLGFSIFVMLAFASRFQPTNRGR